MLIHRLLRRLFLLVADDVRRVGLLPRRTDAEVLDGADVPAGGAVQDVRCEDLAPAKGSLLRLLLCERKRCERCRDRLRVADDDGMRIDSVQLRGLH